MTQNKIYVQYLLNRAIVVNTVCIEEEKNANYYTLIASFGKYFILPRFFAQFFCPDVFIWNFYLHRRSGENLRCFWRRIRHDVAMSLALIDLKIRRIFARSILNPKCNYSPALQEDASWSTFCKIQGTDDIRHDSSE